MKFTVYTIKNQLCHVKFQFYFDQKFRFLTSRKRNNRSYKSSDYISFKSNLYFMNFRVIYKVQMNWELNRTKKIVR